MELSDEFIKSVLSTLRNIGKRLSSVEEKLSLDAENVEENSENTPVFHNIDDAQDFAIFNKTHMDKSLNDAVDLAILHFKKVPPKRRYTN